MHLLSPKINLSLFYISVFQNDDIDYDIEAYAEFKAEFKAERTRKRIQRKAIYQQEIDDGFRSENDYKNVSENSDSDDSDNYETDDEDDEV